MAELQRSVTPSADGTDVSPTAADVTADPPRPGRGRDRWFPIAVYLVVAVALVVVTRLSVTLLPLTTVPPHDFPDRAWFEGWVRWDSGWYWYIAREGYFFAGPGQQSPVAFFPAYPLGMRLLGAVVGDLLLAGVLITFAAGLASALLFHRWCAAAVGRRAARWGLLLLLVSPFAFYLFGVVYSDALFLAAALGAFVLLERDKPWLAGIAGAVATGARPVGVALVVGLAVRALELRGVFPDRPERFATVGGDDPPVRAPTPFLPRTVHLRHLRWRDAGVLLSAGGLVAYCALLWFRFRQPLAFAQVANAPGWWREVSLRGIVKADFFRLYDQPDLSAVHVGLALQAVLTIAALGLVPVVIRRLGWGYGIYSAAVVAIPALASKDFIGMGRYVLAAFPCYAAAAYLLAARPRPRLASAIVGLNAVALAVMASFFARWYFLS